MTLKQKTKSALAEFSARGGGPHYLQVDDGPRRLSCELASVDKLACEFQHLTLHTPALADASTERLQKLAADLAGRLTYLLEPIHPIETDAQGCVVQMRSNPPQRGDDGTCYYELLVRRGGELSLRRWKKLAGGTRTPLSCTVTREVLLRLIGDLAAVV
jgi:hypothetical protein